MGRNRLGKSLPDQTCRPIIPIYPSTQQQQQLLTTLQQFQLGSGSGSSSRLAVIAQMGNYLLPPWPPQSLILQPLRPMKESLKVRTFSGKSSRLFTNHSKPNLCKCFSQYTLDCFSSYASFLFQLTYFMSEPVNELGSCAFDEQIPILWRNSYAPGVTLSPCLSFCHYLFAYFGAYDTYNLTS